MRCDVLGCCLSSNRLVPFFLCSAQVERSSVDLEKQFAVVYSHGLVHWYMPIGQSAAHCPMDITWFPLDTQRCPLIYESWAMPSSQLNITRLEPSVDLSYYQKSGEWHLVGNYAARLSYYHEQFRPNKTFSSASSSTFCLVFCKHLSLITATITK